MSRSTFPNKIDSFVELYDLPPALVAKAKRYQELKTKPTLNATEQAELNQLSTELGNYIITPETWNKFADAVVAVETFFKDQVDGYILNKQGEWSKYVKDFTHKGVYNSSSTYAFQNMVTYNGDLYLCIKNTTKGIAPTNTSYWQKISTKGDKGDVGLNIHLKGVYSATATYQIGDAVIFDGSLFYCIKNTTAGTPPTNSSHWYLYEGTAISKTRPAMTQKGMLWIEEID